MMSQTHSEGSEIRYQLVADGASSSSNNDTIQMTTASGITIMFERDDTCGSDNDQQQNTRNLGRLRRGDRYSVSRAGNQGNF